MLTMYPTSKILKYLKFVIVHASKQYLGSLNYLNFSEKDQL